MNQTSLLNDLLHKFLEKTISDHDLSSLNLLEKWTQLSETVIESQKITMESAINQESSFISGKASSKREHHLKKQPSISENPHFELEKEKANIVNFELETKKATNTNETVTINDVFPAENSEVSENRQNCEETSSKINKYYVLNKTVSFLQKALQVESFEHMNLNTYFLSTYILEMVSSNEQLLKCVAVSHFISLIMESFSSENQSNLNELYVLVNTKQIVLNPHSSSIFSEEQLKVSFLNNFRKILTLRAKSHVSFTKLAKSFAYLIWQKPLFLESLTVFLKEMMINALYKSNTFLDKEFMIKTILQIWSEPRKDLLKLLAETLNRNIELYEIKENRLEQSIFKPNVNGLIEEKKILFNNKICLIAGVKNENVHVSLILNISEKECFERMENLSKDEIAFLEEENNVIISNTSSKSFNGILIPSKEKNTLSNIQEWKKNNSTVNKFKEIIDFMNYNSEKMNTTTFSIEKTFVNNNDFKENIVPKEHDKCINSGNKVERVDIIERTREKSRSKSPMIYYNQQNPYSFDNRLKTITTIINGNYANNNPVLIDNRVRRHFTTNHLPTISNNLFSFN